MLLTLDEVHGRRGRDDLIQVVAEVQHLIRRDKNVALVAAGLPAAVQDLLNEDVTTFLRRAKRFRLGPLTRPDAEDALRIPIEAANRTIASDALEAAVSATYGYPYLVQIIGDYAWKHAPAERTELTLDDVTWAIRRAVYDIGEQVHAPALHDLSPRDRDFLSAMAQDDGPSSIADVAARLGKDANYTSQYRARLLAAEVIAAPTRGVVEFTLPYMAEYLRRLDKGY